MSDHLTPAELLVAMKFCKGWLGGHSCKGCPNAVPGTEGEDGLCECRFDIYNETIHLLEGIVNKNNI